MSWELVFYQLFDDVTADRRLPLDLNALPLMMFKHRRNMWDGVSVISHKLLNDDLYAIFLVGYLLFIRDKLKISVNLK